MGTWLPETCWATIIREIKNTKSDIYLVFLIHTSFCLFAVLMRQLVQQACRAHSLTHMSGNSWTAPCRTITYTEHTFQTHQPQFRHGNCHSVTFRKIWFKKKMLEKHRYTCRLYTRRLLHLRYLYQCKYTGHVYIQYWAAKIFTCCSTETLKQELNKRMTRITSTDYYRLKSMSAHYCSIFESSIINYCEL